MSGPRVYLCLAIACLVLTDRASAQRIQKKFNFRPIEANARLSNSNITAILQDTYGFLWVGTDDGLNRFDGYDFKVYRNVEGDTATLTKNKIQSIFEDSRGTLWVSTLNSGLHYYDRKRDAFCRIAQFSIQHCQVMRIIEDKTHHIWIGGVLQSQAFVARLDSNTNHWTQFPLFGSTDPIYSMLQESDDEFWLGTRLHGLFKWNQKTHSMIRFQHDPHDANSLPGNYIENIQRSDDGGLWIATRNGLCKFDTQHGNYKNYSADSGIPGRSLPVDAILGMCLDRHYLWIATENGGLSRLDTRNDHITTFVHDKHDPSSIINNSIWSLYCDRQGRIWIGSYAKGLCVLDNIEEKFSELDVPLEDDLVNAILKDSKGRIWLGTEAGLVLQDKGMTRYFRYDSRNPKSLSSNAVNCIYEDSRHRIWIGNWNGGVHRYDESGGFVRYVPDPLKKGSLQNANVFAISEYSKTGELLVCTFGGLYILVDEKKGVFENSVNSKYEGDQLLMTTLEDSKKNIWVGSYNGLAKFDRDKRTWQRFFVTNDTTDVSDRINCIFEDSHGRLWIGSFAGLHLMTGPSQFVTYTTKDGLPVNIVQGILEDAHGNLWLGTTHGLTFFDPERKIAKTFDESDGLLTSEFRRRAFFKTAEGQMFVGGKGVNVFYPDSITTNPNLPPVFITDLRVFNQSISPNGEDGILKQAIGEAKEISLSYKHSFFSIHYVGLNFTASYKNQYAYKMEGFDPNWNYVGGQRFATFTNLDPGTYTFRVMASNNDGLWNETGTSLIIHIAPPWWKAIWFRAAFALFASVMIIGIYYLRLNRMVNQNIRLEELVDRRTAELIETNKELELREKEIITQNEELMQGQEEVSMQRDLLSEQNKKLEEASKIIERKNLEILLHNENLEQEVVRRTQELVEHNHQLEQFAFISAHNLRAPVARILGLGEILKLAKSDDEEKAILEKLAFTTRELDKVVKDLNQILDIRKNSSAVITAIDLGGEMEMVRSNLQKEIDETGTRIIEDFSAVKTIHCVKPYVDSILMNLVSNAIKYRHPSRKPVIKVTAENDGDFVCLSVADNGLGINLSKYEDKLFKLYNRFHAHVEGKGMGLYLVKTQVAALGGRIEVSGEVNNGMTFKIYLQAKMESVVVS